MARPGLSSIVKEVRTKHACHTLILYGSHSRGDATVDSDYDLLAIRRAGGEVVRDARRWKGAYLDVFVYPENRLRPAALMNVRGGKVLFQKGRIGDALLGRIEKAYLRGPTPLAGDEAQTRRVWARKMLDRARKGDTEGNFRRVWLLMTLLEDYFALRNRWYEGPKAALAWLRRNDPQVCACFEKALRPGARLSAIRALVDVVVADVP